MTGDAAVSAVGVVGAIGSATAADELWAGSVGWVDGVLRSYYGIYEFTDDPQTPVDIEIANHYTATHPASVFRRTLTIQRVTRDERITLRGETLVRDLSGRISEERIDRARLPHVVHEVFGIALPSGPFVFETAAAATA